MTILRGQSDVSPQVELPVKSMDFASGPSNQTSEVVVWYYLSTGAWAAAVGEAAGTIVTAKLSYNNILNSIKATGGSYNDSSLSFAASTRAAQVKNIPQETLSMIQFMTPTQQVAEITKYLTTAGDYFVDHRRGQIWLNSKATVANDTVTYAIATPFFFSQPARLLNTSQTLAGSNTTVATALFRVTGDVRITKLYAVVTTALGSNQTAAHWRLNDQTAQPGITLATGTTISSAAAGSLLSKKALAAVALTLSTSAAGRVVEPTTLETVVFSEFLIVAKNGANTDIEFVYTTTNTPTSGVLQHFVEWQALSAGASVVAL